MTMLRAQPGPNNCAPAQAKTEHATQPRRVSLLFRPRQCSFRDFLSVHSVTLSNRSLLLGGALSDIYVDPDPRLEPSSLSALRPLSRRGAPVVLRVLRPTVRRSGKNATQAPRRHSLPCVHRERQCSASDPIAPLTAHAVIDARGLQISRHPRWDCVSPW